MRATRNVLFDLARVPGIELAVDQRMKKDFGFLAGHFACSCSASHAERSHGEPSSHHDRRLSILEAALLAFVALLAAWSGFAAAKWTTESRVMLAEASTIRNEGNTVEITGLSLRVRDSVQFNAWFAARAANNPQVEELAIRRFRPECRKAFACIRGSK